MWKKELIKYVLPELLTQFWNSPPVGGWPPVEILASISIIKHIISIKYHMLWSKADSGNKTSGGQIKIIEREF